MIKLNNIEEKMQEHCSGIYWEIDDIEKNLMFIIKEIPNQKMLPELEKEVREIISEYLEMVTFLRSEALELGEKFALFIIDPGVERLKLKEQETGDIVQIINDVLNDQAVKFDNLLKVIETESKNKNINGGTVVLFFESGGNMLNSKGKIINSLRFLANNFNKYQYEIHNKNTKGN